MPEQADFSRLEIPQKKLKAKGKTAPVSLEYFFLIIFYSEFFICFSLSNKPSMVHIKEMGKKKGW